MKVSELINVLSRVSLDAKVMVDNIAKIPDNIESVVYDSETNIVTIRDYVIKWKKETVNVAGKEFDVIR